MGKIKDAQQTKKIATPKKTKNPVIIINIFTSNQNTKRKKERKS